MTKLEINTDPIILTGSPWGRPDQVAQCGPGLVSVQTAGHGGIFVSDWRMEWMPEPLRSFVGYAPPNWYEEDLGWAIPVVAFPDAEWPSHWIGAALDTIEKCGDYFGEEIVRYAKGTRGRLAYKGD